jgi:hypothetical protein
MNGLGGRARTGVLVTIGVMVGPSAAAQKRPVTQPLVTASITGQSVALLPITYVIAEPSVRDSTLRIERTALIHFADSLITDAILARSPEIQWIPPADLRRMARRGAGIVPDPDKLGQSIMRTWSLTIVPDPLRSNLRRMVSVAGGGRYVFIPASLIFRADSTGWLSADLSVVLADARTGRVVWRSLAKGDGATASEVLAKAVDTIFPAEGTHE